jgi:hypothetical protein
MSPILVLAGVGFLTVVLLAILTVIIVGIHRGDRHLEYTPNPGSDAFARRLLVSVHITEENSEEADQ